MFSAVIPVAGLGTRSLPASKAIPKEMLPVFDRPIIQWIAEEAASSGADQIIFVTGPLKSAILDHFSLSTDFEKELAKKNKLGLLDGLKALLNKIKITTAIQSEALGLGHAVLMAKSKVSGSHFAVMLGDEMIDAKNPGLQQLVDRFKSLNQPDVGVVMLLEVPEAEVSKYGICDMAKDGKISRCVEKPKAGETKSRLALTGRYFLPKGFFELLEKTKASAAGEIQLTSALDELARQGKLYGCILEGTRMDAGDRMGFLQANLHYYLKSEFRHATKNLIKEMGR